MRSSAILRILIAWVGLGVVPWWYQVGGKASIKVVAICTDLKLVWHRKYIEKESEQICLRGAHRGNRWFLLFFLWKPGKQLYWVNSALEEACGLSRWGAAHCLHSGYLWVSVSWAPRHLVMGVQGTGCLFKEWLSSSLYAEAVNLPQLCVYKREGRQWCEQCKMIFFSYQNSAC